VAVTLPVAAPDVQAVDAVPARVAPAQRCQGFMRVFVESSLGEVLSGVNTQECVAACLGKTSV
jgi:hypothetical protein